MSRLVYLPFILLGRHASIALPTGVIIGLVFPEIAKHIKPLHYTTLLIPLTLALVRIDTQEVIDTLKNWRLVITLIAWNLIASAIVAKFALAPFSLTTEVSLAAIIAAAAPPITAAAAIALILRVNAAITVTITILSTIIVPVTFPFILTYIVKLPLDVELWSLSIRLCSLIFIAIAIAWLIKRFATKGKIDQSAELLDGLSVASVCLFNILIMDGVTAIFFEKPAFILETFIVSSCLIIGLYIFSTAIFWKSLGPRTAIAVGLLSGNCNMGLMYYVLANEAPIDLLVFFSVAQLPLYFLIGVLKPIIKRIQ